MILLTSMLFGAGVMLWVLRWIEANRACEDEERGPLLFIEDEPALDPVPIASLAAPHEAWDAPACSPSLFFEDDEDEMEPLQPNPYRVLTSNDPYEIEVLVSYPEEMM